MHSADNSPYSPTDSTYSFGSPGPSMAEHIRPPMLFRSQSLERISTLGSCTSSTNLVPGHDSRQRHSKSPSRSSPFFFNWPQQAVAFRPEASPTYRAWEEKRVKAVRRRPAGPTKFWHGWKVILFGSWLNILILVIPVSWILHAVMENSHTLDFIFCTLAMIPLVNMHDLATQDLALRIGGSKTGLVNASLSNIVEMVIAITALRKCELKVVQSSLIGSMLSKMLLVLGACFFAGGLRFTEQDFNADATQIHSSLLSISVGALLLPAAYHFALSNNTEESGSQQKLYILKMSHGVSIVLLFVYCGYLVFQLWSHSHFYQDSKTTSSKLSKSIKIKASRSNTADSPPDTPYTNTSFATSSDNTLTAGKPEQDWSHINLDEVKSRREFLHSREGSAFSDDSVNRSDEQSESRGKSEELTSPEDEEMQPELSWTMTLLLMVSVTVMVSFNAEWLVESLDTIETTISKEWIALVMLPAISSIAECVTAVNVSRKDQLTLSVSVAVSSTIQTALFVIPFMVMLGWAMGKPLALLFDPFESVVLYISVQVMTHVVADGKSNWLEGLILSCLYVIIAVSFWFYPGSDLYLSQCG